MALCRICYPGQVDVNFDAKKYGISLNSMAHPVTNSPEPSYEIDPDKLETIEVDIKMTAYELADDLEGWSDHWMSNKNKENVFAEHANMLRKQADRIAELEKENANLKYEISSSAWQPKEATDQELFNIYAHLQDTYEGDNFPVALGRTILKLCTTPQTKPCNGFCGEYECKENQANCSRLKKDSDD
jgi:hypothetical protein